MTIATAGRVFLFSNFGDVRSPCNVAKKYSSILDDPAPSIPPSSCSPCDALPLCHLLPVLIFSLPTVCTTRDRVTSCPATGAKKWSCELPSPGDWLFGTSSTIVWFGYAMVCWLDEAWQSALWSSNLFFGYLLIKGLYRQQSCLAGLVATALGFILSVLRSCIPWSWTVSRTKYPCTCKLHCYLMVTPAGEAHTLEH